MLFSRKRTKILFYSYLVLLTWGILFKFEVRPAYIPFFRNYRYINWIPFSEPLIVNGQIVWMELVFNLCSFIPFGVLYPILKPNCSTKEVICLGFLLSLLYEVLQYALAIGMSDVTDVLMNTLGVCVGVAAYLAIKKSKSRRKNDN